MVRLSIALSLVGPIMAQTQLDIEMVPMLQLTGKTGTTNQIQYLTALNPTNVWIPLVNIVLSNSTVRYVDTRATGESQRIYRVETLEDNLDRPLPTGMVLIPEGSFQMGDSIGDSLINGYHFELPVHEVWVSAFLIDKFEVTHSLWNEVYQWATNNGYSFEGHVITNSSALPATAKWDDAVKWCNARSEKEGLIPAYYTNTELTAVYRTGRLGLKMTNELVNWLTGYRLPTEAEWEKAARGGLSGKRFPCGDTISHSQANYYSDSFNPYDISPTRGLHPSFESTANINGMLRDYPIRLGPIGFFEPNGYGLYDMVGNVSEWCWDWYGAYPSEITTDPKGPNVKPGLVMFRIARGGNSAEFSKRCRLAYRGYDTEDPNKARYPYSIGFRCVMSRN